MAHFIRGHRPSTHVTILTALGLFLLGCVFALLEWRLPIIDPLGHGINYTRLAPLVILVVLIPAILPLYHRRHPWPFWFYTVSVELAAGLIGYSLLFHILSLLRSDPPAVGVWGSWFVTGLSLVAIWLTAIGVAAIGITTFHRFRKPGLEPRCAQCGYLLFGLRAGNCPECGSPIVSDDLPHNASGA